MQETDQDGIIKMLHTVVAGYPSHHSFAKECGISDGYLSDILRGRRDISKKALDKMGVKRVVVYRPMENDNDKTDARQ